MSWLCLASCNMEKPDRKVFRVHGFWMQNLALCSATFFILFTSFQNQHQKFFKIINLHQLLKLAMFFCDVFHVHLKVTPWLWDARNLALDVLAKHLEDKSCGTSFCGQQIPKCSMYVYLPQTWNTILIKFDKYTIEPMKYDVLHAPMFLRLWSRFLECM